MPRVFFIAPHRPGRSPSQRFRFEQFVPYWEARGYEFTYGWSIDERDDRVLYRQGALAAKAKVYVNSWRRRSRLMDKLPGHDLIILQRETFMMPGIHFERKLAASGIPVIYDFDDALWIRHVSKGNRMLAWLKNPGKIDRLLPLADMVIAGNEFLADHARRYNPAVVTIPTVVDASIYRPIAPEKPANDPLVIGWTGSSTTIQYLELAIPALRELKRKVPVPFRLRIISDVPLKVEGLDVEYRKWNKSSEVADLQDIDIGIMPMERDDWNKGKCAFKGIQYMAVGRPTVMENFGAAPSVIRHGVDGLLASSKEEWVAHLAQLLADADLRRRLGRAARTTIEERFSVQAWQDRYLQIFQELIGKKHK